MAMSHQTALSDGTLKRFDITIDYFDRDEINVYIAGDYALGGTGQITDRWRWLGATDRTILFDEPIPAGQYMTVKRHTRLVRPRHSFTGGAAFTAKALDDNFQQNIRIVQEAKEQLSYAEVAQEGVASVNGRVGQVIITGNDVAQALGGWPQMGGGTVPSPRNAVIYAYIRSPAAPTTNPGDITFDFMQGRIIAPTTTQLGGGWFSRIPDGAGNLYVTMCTASSPGDTDTVLASEWAGPALMGQDGLRGLNSASVYIYQRTSANAAPLLPTTDLTYTFQGAVLSGSLGAWTTSVPAASGGKYLWVSTASAVATTPTDTIPYSEWASVQCMAADGTNGTPGKDGNPGNPGQNGQRGTARLLISGRASWDVSVAEAALRAGGFGLPMERDEVTQYNGSSFSEVRFYSSGSWLVVGKYIHGNMIVDGTLSANAITTGALTGLTYRTSAGDERVSINESGDNTLKLYRSGSLAVRIGGVASMNESGAIWASGAFSTAALMVSNTTSGSTVSGDALWGSAVNGSGVAGSSGGGIGVKGWSTSLYGVQGDSSSGFGGSFTTRATSADRAAVQGVSPGQAFGVKGQNTGNNGYGGIFQGPQNNVGGSLLLYGRIVQDTTGNPVNSIGHLMPGLSGVHQLGQNGYAWQSVWVTGGVVQNSDKRLKRGIRNLKHGLEFINKLRPVEYHFKTDEQKTKRFGLIAQEVRAALDDDNTGLWMLGDKGKPKSHQAVVYGELISPLIQAVKELSAELEALKADFKAYKSIIH
jgi:hypothetical protein